jgi:hypothetical protein
MRRRHFDDASSPALVRTCDRCRFTLPQAYFEGTRSTCSECQERTPVQERVASMAVDYMLRCHAAMHLLNLGLTAAAAEVLASNRWPSLAEARRMQQSKVA